MKSFKGYIDDFLPNAKALREQGLALPFYDYKGKDGEVYKRVYITEIEGLKERLEKLFGSEIEMLMSGYRLNYNGELPNAAIHSDLGWGEYALVLYLSEGPGGTAFWRHKATGAERLPPDDIKLLMEVEKDWNNVEAWEQVSCIEMKFGRAAIYDSTLFHSRWPFEAFGDSPETGRLIIVAFFNVKEPPNEVW